MAPESPVPFEYDGGVVQPGEKEHVRFAVAETYLGEPMRIPVTIINGTEPGPTAFLAAASHGDELNGIGVVREIAHEWNHTGLCGTVVCLPVLNPQGFLTQQRYLPIYDRDLNRSFPGRPTGTSAQRMAHAIWTNFIEPCDFGVDFHTSTRGRTNMLHVRADMLDPAVARLARAFGTNLIISGSGASGMLRRVASERGVPTTTVEMGEAHRFEQDLIEYVCGGIKSVFAEYGLYPQEVVHWPGWRTVVVAIRLRILDATLHIFEESNHMPFWEEPDARYEVVNLFSTTSPTDSLRTLGGRSSIESIGLPQFAVDDYGVCGSRASR